METSEKEFTQEESLLVIQRMINTVKNDLEDDSFYFLLWGWFVFAASGLNYILMQTGYEQQWLPWAVLMPLGSLITAIYSWKHESKKKVRTYTDEIMKYVLIAFLVSLFISLFFQSKLQLNTYPMVMTVYGMWLFVSGGAIKFKPLIYGGIINWVLGIAAFFVSFEIQLLLLASAVLLGYIIPGHLLKNKYKQQKKLSS